jgi:transposase
MKEELPALAESLNASSNRPLIQQKIEHRACMVALAMEGVDHRAIAAFTQVHQRTIHRWACRIHEGNLFTDLPRSGRPRTFSEAARLSTIAVYCQQAPPLPGVNLWSLRVAERFFEEHSDIVGGPISRATIQRILLEHALRPHRRKYYLQITDPDFFAKMESIIDLYLNPPDHLYCFDECTCIQALKRLTPDLPPAPGRPLLEDFDYKRNGTTDLIAFLNPPTGMVYGECVPDHNRHTLCRVFTAQVRTLPAEETIHYIADNLTTHYHEDFCKTVARLSGVRYPVLKTGAERRRWLTSEDKRIVVHFVPFHASWLNLVEIWFGILKSMCLKNGRFYSVEQLVQDILAFIGTWNECFAHPFSWSYTGDGLHAKAVRRFSQLLALETNQMDCRFLKSQLLLMSNIAENYLEVIPPADWLRLVHLASEKAKYMESIIEADAGPVRQKTAREAYDRFVTVVTDPVQSLANTGQVGDILLSQG